VTSGNKTRSIARAEFGLAPNRALRVPKPSTIGRGRIIWTYAAALVLMHALGFLALVPWLFSWTGVAALILGILVCGETIILGYHRLLAHNSFAVPKWLEYTMAVFNMCSLHDTPVRWVTAHRMHHKYSDHQNDPHTPLAGWAWGHALWLLFPNSGTRNPIAYRAFAHDLLQDPFYRLLERYPWLQGVIWLAQVYLYFGFGFLLGWAIDGTAMAGVQLGASLVVWGVILRTIATWHITWSVNSFVHLYGYRTYNTRDNSRNNWILAIVASGEGWHHNHHHDPASASNQHKWWELDASFAVLWCWEKIGLAKNVIRPRCRRQAARAAAAE